MAIDVGPFRDVQAVETLGSQVWIMRHQSAGTQNVSVLDNNEWKTPTQDNSPASFRIISNDATQNVFYAIQDANDNAYKFDPADMTWSLIESIFGGETTQFVTDVTSSGVAYISNEVNDVRLGIWSWNPITLSKSQIYDEKTLGAPWQGTFKLNQIRSAWDAINNQILFFTFDGFPAKKYIRAMSTSGALSTIFTLPATHDNLTEFAGFGQDETGLLWLTSSKTDTTVWLCSYDIDTNTFTEIVDISSIPGGVTDQVSYHNGIGQALMATITSTDIQGWDGSSLSLLGGATSPYSRARIRTAAKDIELA